VYEALGARDRLDRAGTPVQVIGAFSVKPAQPSIAVATVR
jgi:hypothetical protein